MQEAIQEVSIPPAPKPKARYSAWFKLLAVLVALAGALNASYFALDYQNIRFAFSPSAYEQSEDYLQLLSQASYSIRDIAFESTDEQTYQEFSQARQTIIDTYRELVNKTDEEYQQNLNKLEDGEDIGWMKEELEQNYRTALGEASAYFNESLSQNSAQAKQQADLANAAIVSLAQTEGVQYAYDGGNHGMLTNLDRSVNMLEHFSKLPHAAIFTRSKLLAGPAQATQWCATLPDDGSTMYIGFTPERYSQLEAQYNARWKAGMDSFRKCLMGVLATVLGLVWLLYAAGRRPAAAGVVLSPTDRVFLDVQLVLYGSTFGICFYLAVSLINAMLGYQFTVNKDILVMGYQACVAAVVLFGLLFLTSAAKRAKRGELLRHTLVFVVLRAIWRGLRSLAMGLKASTRHVLAFVGFILVYGLIAISFGASTTQYYLRVLSFFLFLAGFLLAVAALSFVLHKVVSFKNLSTAVRRIQAGELGVRVPAGGGTEFAQLAGSINNLADGLKAAVDSEVKAERMRAELVTNVSHDLKTPLTSIVTYVDLLKTEGLTSENAPHYLDVIDQKAARLKTLTADLFEAAKAASGTMPVNLERVDANALLAQGLSELSDRILASGLDIKLQLPADRLLLRADGRLLWRVMENLLSNVFKYALKGSRVYLSATRLGGRGVLTLKNISAYELNIAPEELTERFTRGDASRHSEGSGLGLSIARSLTELQGGELRIEIDGDLFKAIISLPVWEE